MSLLEELESIDKKGLFKSNDYTVSYPTGYTVLDYANGYWADVQDPKTGEYHNIPVVGIPAGSIVSVIGYSGTGKAIPNSTLVPTPVGYKKVGEIREGDYLFDRRGRATRVIGVFPQGKIPSYKITFDDGREAVCSEDHLWSIYGIRNRRQVFETISTKEMFDSQSSNKFFIPINKAVDYFFREIAVDPWVLGVFIAKGVLTEKYLEISIKGVSDLAEKIATRMHWTPKKLARGTTYRFIDKYGNDVKTADFLKDCPKLIGAKAGDKFVPENYLYNSLTNRKALLSGMLDACASFSADTNYRIIYSTTCVTLKKNIEELARSLGYKCSLAQKPDFRPKYNNGACYKLLIECADDEKIILFNTEQKNHAASEGFRKYGYSRTPDRIEITKIIKQSAQLEMTCFKVDNDEELFLMDDYIVTHNTTFCIQAGWNIVKNFDDGVLQIIDCEKSPGTERQRIANLLGVDYDEPRFKIQKAHSSIEDVLDSVNKVCEIKEAGGKKYMYEVKNQSFDGKPFWMYVPTVYIIDSLPKFNSSEFNTDDLGGNIDQMRAAKDITRFYTNVIDKAWQYNIIFFMINHIRPATITDPYKVPKGLMMINPMAETLPRGQVPLYYASTFFRINSKKSDANTIDSDGFDGFKCEIQLAKTKTNMVGTSFPVTFNTKIGFDPIFSIYEFAKSLGLVKGKNPYLVIDGFEERKFNRKEFATLMRVDDSFRRGVLGVLRPYYEALLGSKVVHEDTHRESVDLSFDQ